MYYEHRFYRDVHPETGELGSLNIAIIPVEFSPYWDAHYENEIVDEGEVIHFDTLYEDYVDSLLADTYPVQETDEELDAHIEGCLMALGIGVIRQRSCLDEGYEQVTRDYTY